MEMAKLIALLLTVWTLLGLSKGLRCYCNTTASIVVNVNCRNQKFCETDYMCGAHRFYSINDQRYVTEWECFTSTLNGIRIDYQSQDSCNGDSDTNQTSYKCCNDSEYCNRHLDVTVPDEQPTSDEVPTSRPTAAPSVVPSPSPDPNSGGGISTPKRLKCYCNSTDNLPDPNCSANSFTCETESACVTHRYINEMDKVVTRWYCLDHAHIFYPHSQLCQLYSTRNAIRCCNGSDYCNREIILTLLNEQLPTTSPTTSPTTTGTTEFAVNRPVDTPESLLYMWLTVGVIGLAFLVAAVVLAVSIGIVVRYYRVKRKVALSRHQFNSVTCKTTA